MALQSILLILLVATIVEITRGDTPGQRNKFGLPKCCEHEFVGPTAIESCPKPGMPTQIDRETFNLMLCNAKCVAENINVLTGDEIDFEKLAAYAKTSSNGNPEMEKVLTELVTTCKGFVNKESVPLPLQKHLKKFEEAERTADGKKCSHKIFFTLNCIEDRLATKCPEKLKILNEQCSKIDSHVQNWKKKLENSFNHK